MNRVPMIHVSGLCKTFRLYQKPFDRLKEIFTKRNYHREHHALRDVSFDVGNGETFGIIGENGSGKSTLLKIITGVLLPDSGHFHVEGKITGLLELGTGFNYECSGMDNIYMNGAYIGIDKKNIRKKLDDIIAFTELGDFIKEPIKTYSSGMLMRLAFSIAFHADPACFVVDEALAVGDAHFQQKCIKTLKDFKKKGGSIVFVSHDMNAVKILCEKAILLDKGEVRKSGTPESVINAYNYLISSKNGDSEFRLIDGTRQAAAYGNKKVVFEQILVKNRHDQPTEILTSGEPCIFEFRLTAMADLDQATVGIMIRDRFGQDIFGVNTYLLNKPIRLRKNESKLVRFSFAELNIGPGKFTLTVAAHSDAVHVHDCYQWIDGAAEFEIVSGSDFLFAGIARLRPEVSVDGEYAEKIFRGIRSTPDSDPETDQEVRSAFQALLGREPESEELLSFVRELRTDGLDPESLLHELLDSPEYVGQEPAHGDADFWRVGGRSRDKAYKLQNGPMSMETFQDIVARLLPDEEKLVIGQKEYLRTHGRRFLELANAVSLLTPERGGILEFGVSEFSRIYKELRPHCRLVTSDRPVEPDFIGFTPERCRRIANCDVHVALDLEDDASPAWKELAALGPFDLIVFAEVLEHLLVDPATLLRNLLQMLSDKGYLYLTTPNFFCPANRKAWAEKRNPQPMYPGRNANWDAHHHFREYSLPEILQLIRVAEGRVLTCYFSDYWDDPADRLRNRPDLGSGLVLLAGKR